MDKNKRKQVEIVYIYNLEVGFQSSEWVKGEDISMNI